MVTTKLSQSNTANRSAKASNSGSASRNGPAKATRKLPALTDAIVVPEVTADSALFEARRIVLRDLLKLSTALAAEVTDLSETLLQRFCYDLTQYLSTSHYRAFQSSVAQPQRFIALASTSREIMRFTDRFDHGTTGVNQSLGWVREQLGTLALTLETRFQLEDDLLAAEPISVAH